MLGLRSTYHRQQLLSHASTRTKRPVWSSYKITSDDKSIRSVAPTASARLRFTVVQGPFSLIPYAKGLLHLLGTSFWDVEFALVGNDEPDYSEPSNIVGSNLYGLQLVLQLFVAHLFSLGSTISIVVTTLPEEHRHQRQVVAMASLQLKSAGPELVKAISCKRGAPVVTLSNLAVLKMWRRRGVGEALLQFAQDTALDNFGVDDKEDVYERSKSTPSTAGSSELHVENKSGRDNVADRHSDRTLSFSVRESEDDIRFPGSSGIFSFQQEPEGIALMVYKDNLAAIRLYQRTGWYESEWMDPQWLEDAERNRPRIRPARRLYFKPWKKLQGGHGKS
ncbi:hypothetical protein DUNSADRAFT_502 [Dunaliella salina]|uniref:N-acetyltransferase domain-containing protein n=1 Tax=Dunaliella salina TaxID=3046 RepID=A0ABQ7FYS7_DUNSA|nr:hypothetical protein DUNSADRAFT_502 [Dunaliella salina]|eukprot:KAF5827517.1 hypothetical protein DUNSADRAFT_502 [Dunaliella salina]